jgi:hypothetical protein
MRNVLIAVLATISAIKVQFSAARACFFLKGYNYRAGEKESELIMHDGRMCVVARGRTSSANDSPANERRNGTSYTFYRA